MKPLISEIPKSPHRFAGIESPDRRHCAKWQSKTRRTKHISGSSCSSTALPLSGWDQFGSHRLLGLRLLIYNVFKNVSKQTIFYSLLFSLTAIAPEGNSLTPIHTHIHTYPTYTTTHSHMYTYTHAHVYANAHRHISQSTCQLIHKHSHKRTQR